MSKPQKRKPVNPERSAVRRAIGVLLISELIVLIAFGVAYSLFKAKPQPESTAQAKKGLLVEVLEAAPTRANATLHRHGEVEPRTQIDLVPEVSGKVRSVSENLINGGYFAEGEVLLKLDPRDYELAVQRARATLESATGAVELRRADIASARSRLEQELAEAKVSLDEWRRENPGVDAPALVAREPQLAAAKAALASAEAQLTAANAEVGSARAALEQAQLNLQRTTITAPFAGRVMNESVDVGQFVMAGAPLAKVYATDVVQIVVPVESDQMRWFDLPENDAAAAAASGSQADDRSLGVPARVEGTARGVRRTWPGRAVRTTGMIDPRSRMERVVVEVTDPRATGGAPLVPGMFVDVAIEGRAIDGVYRIPRHAVHRHETTFDAQVWLVVEGKLAVAPVTVTRYHEDEAWVTDGLSPGDRVVTSPMEAPVVGMAVRTEGDTPPATVNATESAIKP